MLQIGMPVKTQNRMANSVDPDATANDEPSHKDLHFLHRYLDWIAGLKGLKVPATHIFGKQNVP